MVSGTNLVNTTVSLVARVYTNATAGDFLYEDASSVAVVDGLYTVYLGAHPVSGSLADAFAHGETFIEFTINGDTLTPRERVGAVAYALVAGSVVSGAVTSASIRDGSIAADDLSTNVTGSFVSRSGDTMTGALAISGPATSGSYQFRIMAGTNLVGWARSK